MYKKLILIIIGILLTLGAIFVITQSNQPHTTKPSPTFAQLRKAHQTNLLESTPSSNKPLPHIYRADVLEHTTYQGPLGTMGAIASLPSEPGVMKPAVIWINGGFTGTSAGDTYDTPSNDQGIASFLDKDIIVFKPTLRGMHENPGVFECFYGEVGDIVAAVQHVAQRPDVDPSRIYLMGHSTGGTIALLASMLTDIPAAVIAFGAAPDLQYVRYGVEPFDTNNITEIRLRSAIHHTKDIKVPILYIEGESSSYCEDARAMETLAAEQGVDFKAAIVPGQDHFSVLHPAKELLAQWIQEGKQGLPTPTQVSSEINAYFRNPTNKLIMQIYDIDAQSTQRLFDQGADPNHVDESGWALLELASYYNPNPEVVETIINAGADVNQDWGKGWTSLLLAARYNENPQVAVSLIKSDANINHQNNNGYTALLISTATSPDLTLVNALIENGADVNIANNEGATPLMAAAQNTQNPEIISTLLNAGADPKRTSDSGKTALEYAISNEALQGTQALEQLKQASQ